MKEEIKEALVEHRNNLLREAKQEKSEDYKKGYIDAVLDFYNKIISDINEKIKE